MFAMTLYACFKRISMFQTHVASVYLDVAQVDLDVAMAIQTCFKRIFRLLVQGGTVASHRAGTYGQQMPPRRAPASKVGDGTHMGLGTRLGCAMGCWGTG